MYVDCEVVSQALIRGELDLGKRLLNWSCQYPFLYGGRPEEGGIQWEGDIFIYTHTILPQLTQLRLTPRTSLPSRIDSVLRAADYV